MNVLGPYMPEPTPASTPDRKHQIEMQCHRLRTSYMKRRFPIPQTVCKERLKRNHENNRDSTEDGKQILPRNIRLGLGKRESIKERKQIPRRKSRFCLRLAQMVVRSETTVSTDCPGNSDLLPRTKWSGEVHCYPSPDLCGYRYANGVRVLPGSLTRYP